MDNAEVVKNEQLDPVAQALEDGAHLLNIFFLTPLLAMVHVS
jgi:hypothetical protein